MDFKRITLFGGHYGSGKTNIALNYAYRLRQVCEKVAIADLDIVNPYFRTGDSAKDLKEKGIRLIISPYAGSNVDIPALPQDIYAITDDKSLTCVIDVGGDDRGALALGRIAPAILEENNYEMLFVINGNRPLTTTAEDTVEIMREIEYAGGIPFTAIVNNTNLGRETTAKLILDSAKYAKAVSERSGLPIKMTCAVGTVAEELRGKIPDLFPLKLQSKIE